MNRFTLAAGIVATLAAFSAHASETINIPVADARFSNLPISCFDTPMGIVASAPKNDCQVTFSLPLAVGHTVHQISVQHSCNGTAPGTCTFQQAPISAVLEELFVAGTANGQIQQSFLVSDTVPVTPPGLVESLRMMGQTGSTFPDSFVIAAGKVYDVRVTVNSGTSELRGIQVIYD